MSPKKHSKFTNILFRRSPVLSIPIEQVKARVVVLRTKGLTPVSLEAATIETLDCYPEAGIDNAKAILSYRTAQRSTGVTAVSSSIRRRLDGHTNCNLEIAIRREGVCLV